MLLIFDIITGNPKAHAVYYNIVSENFELLDENNSIDSIYKRTRSQNANPPKKPNVAKILRNRGQAYTRPKSKRLVPSRSVKSACTNCRLKCSQRLSADNRTELFNNYWKLGNIDLQRAYIRSCMAEINPKYRYVRSHNSRRLNHAFYFTIADHKYRVCKTFFISTLDITDRTIRTVIAKTDKTGFVETDLRGRCRENKKA